KGGWGGQRGGLQSRGAAGSDIDRSITFYERWAGLKLVDRLGDPKTGAKAARLGDGNTPFVVALVQTGQPVEDHLAGMGHLGVGAAARRRWKWTIRGRVAPSGTGTTLAMRLVLPTANKAAARPISSSPGRTSCTPDSHAERTKSRGARANSSRS